MEHTIFLNGKQVHVIAYFVFEATKEHYIIYFESGSSTIYLGNVKEKDGVFCVTSVEKTASFLLKKFIRELIEKDMSTVKGYQYFNKLPELKDNFEYIGSQAISLNETQKKSLEEFITEINSHNGEILEKAKEEYYLQLVEEKTKEKRMVIILLVVLIIVLSLIAKMVIDFIHAY